MRAKKTQRTPALTTHTLTPHYSRTTPALPFRSYVRLPLSEEPRDREQQLATTTLIHRRDGLSARRRRRIRTVASHGAPRERRFEQRRAVVF